MKKKIVLSLLLICLCSCSTKEEVVETFELSYQEIEIIPGKDFQSSALKDEELNFMELSSCAFDGNDKVYTYENMEITVSPLDGKDIVYSVYFLNDRITTKEGVKITDDKETMIETYGENYKNINNKYSYLKGDVLLSFIIENDVIISIEYMYSNN
ncbi:MAG: hypothetical protein GX641_01465 [Mollicutes bacterium]|nr:hypothetical protein [Mollicutes bacterium]